MKQYWLAALLLALVAAAPASACSCITPDGSRSDQVRRGFHQAKDVFSAYVASEYRTDGSDSRRMVRLRILQVWKGNLASNTWLEVESDSESGLVCGVAATVDSAVLAYTTGPVLAACTMTSPLDKATQDIPLLNKLARRRK